MFATVASVDLKSADPVIGVEADLAEVENAIDRLLTAGFEGMGERAAAVVTRLERQCRRLQAAQVELLSAIDKSGAFATDGHFSAKVMVRHHGKLSAAEAAHRDGSRRALNALPEIAQAYLRGDVGTDQVRRITKVWSNRRVREQVSACEATFLEAASELEFCDFDSFCRDWEHTVDVEGALSKTERRWQRRDVRLVQDFDSMFDLRGRLMSLDGAELSEILTRLADSERLSDIAAAKHEYGDDWRLHLPRTGAQLRHDAFMKLVRRGAGANPAEACGAEVVTNIVIDQATFEHQLAVLSGADPEPLDPTFPGRRSNTAGGTWVNPSEVVARALTGHVRRVVVDATGVVIDVGRRQRLFTGSPRMAAMLGSTRCYWHGCWTSAIQCEIDHLLAFSEGGHTNPHNGLPACRGHNLLKQRHRFHTWRSPDGGWIIQRPDGTRVPDHNTHWHEPRAA